MRVVQYQLGKFVPAPGEDTPIFKEPDPSDIPSPSEEEWKRRQEEYADQTPIKMSPPPESGGGLAPLALLAGALFLL